MNWILRLAKQDDVEYLTRMSKAAFDTDDQVGGQGGGPTGYDSVEWHGTQYQNKELYVFEIEDEIVGGGVFRKDGKNLEIHRIFIDPNHHRKGYGLLFMQAIENYFHYVNYIKLDTPVWNTRTNPFYQKCGYRKTGTIYSPWFTLNVYEKNVFDEKTKKVLNYLVRSAKEALQDNYVGVYIHGSLAMSGYNPSKSDIDFIIVCEKEPTITEKHKILMWIEGIWDYAPAKGFEMHLMCKEDCQKLADEPRFVLHYSAMHRQSFRANPGHFIGYMHGNDGDLNAHLTILKARGICYDGEPIADVFGEVEIRNYVDSILGDLEWNEKDTIYHVLNAARSLAYMREEVILSKREAAFWGITNLQEFGALFIEALRCIDGEEEMQPSELAERFCKLAYAEIQRYRLEINMWEAEKHQDKQGFLKLVDENATMVCGGYRCTGRMYSDVVQDLDLESYHISHFEIVHHTDESYQLHYTIEKFVKNPYNKDLKGLFHVCSTWHKFEDCWKLVFHMDSKVKQ